MGDYSINNYAWTNAKMQLFDKHKGNIGNRIACAGELVLNNEVKNIKLAGVAGGTVLALDTFAGNKTVVNGAKKLATSAGNKAMSGIAKLAKDNKTAGNIINKVSSGIDKLATYADDAAIKVKNSNLAKKAVNLADDVANNKSVKNAASKVADVATKVKNSSLVKNLSKHKAGIVIATGVAAAATVLVKWAQKNADIEQKYEDKAKAQG